MKLIISDVSLYQFVDALMNANIVGIYWFFIPLFAVYLSIPFLSLIPKARRKEAYGYGVIVAFFTVSLMPLIFNLLNINFNGSLKIPVVSGNIIFVLIGYLVDNYELTKKQRKIIYILGLIGFVTHLAGTYYFSYAQGSVSRMFKGYNNAPSVLYSTAIFVFFKYINNEKIVKLLSKWSQPFASITFGVYLIHWYIIQLILMVTNISMRSVLYRTFGVLFVFLISAMIVKVIQKIPFLNKVLPS